MRQSPARQDLLLKSSILEWMSEPLVKALMGSGVASEQTLKELAAAGLFVELVDEDAGTYRYHDLFRELLSQRLTTRFSVQEIAGVHRAASRWFIENGYIEESVRHALAAGDSLTAARVVEESIHTLLNREENVRLQHVMELLPPDLIETRAALLLAKAWNLHFETRFGAYLPVLEQAEQLMQEPGAMPEEQARALRGDIAALKSQVLVWQSRSAVRCS
jgi:ATP/maltotriose-dependent transcriptional regulator MalT